MNAEMVNLLAFTELYPDEESCVRHLEEARWHSDVRSPFTGGEVYHLKTRFLYKCKDTGKQFSVRQGTIFEESRLPLRKWFMALYILNSLKKGVSSIQLGKFLGVTQKTAWFMLQRIRYAVEHENYKSPLEGTVEIDETYMGGKHHGGKRERGSDNKTPVLGIAKRDGGIHCEAVPNVKIRAAGLIIRENVKIGSTVNTDEYRIYPAVVGQDFNHQVVNHRQGEYVRGKVHTNTVEGFWSHLKRGIKAIYIQVSKKHLNKYCKEYEFRYNTRKMSDFDRFCAWFTLCNGRLTYQTLIAA